MAKAGITMQFGSAQKELKDLIYSLDQMVRHKAVDTAMKSAAKPVLARMRKLAPVSSGSRKKQSKSTASKWQNSRKLKTTLRSVVRKRSNGSTVYVGPSYYGGGGHGNLFSRDHKRMVLWGKDTGRIRRVNRFVKDTADQSKAESLNALNRSLRTTIEQEAKRLGRSGHG